MNNLSKPTWQLAPALLVGVSLCISVLAGVLIAFLVNNVGNRWAVLFALPAILVVGLIFLLDRQVLFFLIILFRAALDPILEVTKFGGFGLGAVLNALVIVIASIAIMQRPNPAQKIFRQTWLVFLLISSITMWFSPDFIATLKTYLTLVSYAAIFVLAITLINSEEDYGKWMRAVYYSSFIPVIYAFVDAATGGFVSSEGFRISSTFSHPNIFAFYLVLIISLGFYFYKSNAEFIPVFIRKTIPLYILLMLALLVMTKTRSAWATCFIFFTVYGLIYERKYLLVIFFLPIVALLVPEIRDRFADLAQGNELVNNGRLNSYAWRKMIWSQSLQWMNTSHYFFGYGLEAFKYYSTSFFTMSGGVHYGAHSVYVQLFFETGMLGLSAFIWLHIKFSQLILPFYKRNKLMIFTSMMFLLEFALNSYSDNMLSYLSFNWYLWFVLGATYAIGNFRYKVSSGSASQNNDKHSKLNTEIVNAS